MANSGFPTWTLWGMGVAAFGALLFIALALLAQTPRMLSRLKLTGQRLDLRARSFTGYGLALLLLAMGFFIAGVPLGSPEETAGPGADVATETAEEVAAGAIDASGTLTDTVPSGGNSGAMVGLPTSTGGGSSGAMVGLATPSLTETLAISGTAELDLPPGAAAVDTTPTPPAATETPGPTETPTPFPTVTPTMTPSPTLTPTPIVGPTARVGDDTSTLPVRRLPGGDILVVLVRDDIVLPLSGHAFHTGEVWREISTVDGVIGWVPEQFIEYPEE